MQERNNSRAHLLVVSFAAARPESCNAPPSHAFIDRPFTDNFYNNFTVEIDIKT